MTTLFPSSCPDADLVIRCRQGDRDAYRQIVERHQALICAVTYSACGDIHQSEDLAQETFLQAWKHLADLQDPSRLRAWLCGIARHLTCSARRKQRRAPALEHPPEEETLPAAVRTPEEEAITQEEHALLWQHLERLPDDYRDPLILFYRQQESVTAVAAALDLSEPAVRQRLSRGRALLAEHIERRIRLSLRQNAPTAAFTLAVVAALPGMAVSASTATLGAATIKGSASAKVAASAGAVLHALLGPLIGLLAGYLGYRVGMNQTIAPEEQRFIRRFFIIVLLLAVVFTGGLMSLVYAGRHDLIPPSWLVAGLATMPLTYLVTLLVLCFWYQRQIRRLRHGLLTTRPELLETAQEVADCWNFQYRSRWTLLGLPLVHINIGSSPEARPLVARGWIALGAKAYGILFASGAIAVGGVSFGGFSVGLLTWGGFALGMLTWGGFAVGLWTLGGIAVGWHALGAFAVGIESAQGVAAMARSYAAGMVVGAARHGNDAAAEAYFATDRFFLIAKFFCERFMWLAYVVGIMPFALMFYYKRRRNTK